MVILCVFFVLADVYMIEPNLSLQKPLEDYVEYIEKMNTRSLPLLDNIAGVLFSFEDPYHNVSGVAAAQELLAHRFRIYSNSRYKVNDFAWGRRESTAYIYWSFIYSVEKRNLVGKRSLDDRSFSGISEVVFSNDGKLLSHSDFWAAHDGFDIKAYKSIDIE